MKRLFGNLKMRWPAVVLFAVAAGVYTGLIMLVSFLDNTSFQDIGISYEWWVIFAVVIVVNCKKGLEAALKCFVFFLISQPLVFLVEILLGPMTWDLGLYYLRSWLPIMILTLPGGFIAWYCKKQNTLGAVVLGLGNTIQAFLGVSYLSKAITDFPHHLLSSLVCFVSIFVMSFFIQKEKKQRWISILLPLILVAVLLVLLKLTGRTL